MRRRFVILALLLVVTGAIAIWFSRKFGGESWLLWFMLLPMVIGAGPSILLPRKPAIGWAVLVALVAATLSALALKASSSCSGDGCLGYFFFAYFAGAPVAVVSVILAIVRFLAKAKPLQACQSPEPVAPSLEG
jgi:hypothetical protein